MENVPTFLPTPDEAKAVMPIAAALMPESLEANPMLLMPNGESKAIPRPLANILAIAAQALVRGNAVSLTIHSSTLTTKQAADMLACSRQHVVKLIDTGKLKAEKVPGGTHRRVKLSDLLEFIQTEDHNRQQLMNDITAIVEDTDGYTDFHAWNQARKMK
jgi:excisionase family DNA binding protein